MRPASLVAACVALLATPATVSAAPPEAPPAATAAPASGAPAALTAPVAPTAPAPNVTRVTPTERQGRLAGRVFERGSITALPDASVTAGERSTYTDDAGGFSLDLAAGEVEVVVTALGHEPLRLRERVNAGEQLTVEYRLLPLAGTRPRYQTTVRGAARHEGERFTLRDEELRQAPGALGDPFRVIGSLPGVATPLPLLPAYVIRGASPGNSGYFLDGIRVPQLFHFLVGGGVIHPGLVERLDFYPGAYDVSFGRYAGGVIDSTTRAARTDARVHGELELRVYDVSALVEAQLPGKVGVMASGHYGYPGPVIHLLEPRVDLSYWDYQLRGDWRGLTVQALGSSDVLTLSRELLNPNRKNGQDARYSLMFHRVQVRYQLRRGRFDLDSAIVGGYDLMTILGGQGVRKLGLAGRVTARWSNRWLRLAGGLDAEISRFEGLNFAIDNSAAAPDALGELAGKRNGVVASAWAQGTLTLDPLVHRPLALTVGARIDTYHAGAVTLLGVDPRVLLRYEPTDRLTFTAGFGLYQQPPSFPVPLPGLDTFALQLGLQRAWQGAVGVAGKLPAGFTLSLTGYYERFANINDVITDLTAVACTTPPSESLTGVPAQLTRPVDGASFGMEVLLRRSIGRASGWIAYTLSRSERLFSCGLRPSDFDQRHLLNVVVQVRLPWRLVAGARLYYASGRPYTRIEIEDVIAGQLPPRNNARLPDYLQIDVRLDREWLFKKWALAAFVEVLNLTYSRSIFGYHYQEQNGIVLYGQPVIDGFRWVLPSIGIRGRF